MSSSRGRRGWLRQPSGGRERQAAPLAQSGLLRHPGRSGDLQPVPLAQGGLLRDPRGEKRWSPAPLSQGGFTLLEIMVALAIIAVAFVALLGLRNRDVVLHEYGRSLIRATALAQQRMADTTVAGFPEVGTTEGVFDDEHARFRWRQDVNVTPFDFVHEVRVTVLWNEPPREDRVDLVSYVFERIRGRGAS